MRIKKKSKKNENNKSIIFKINENESYLIWKNKLTNLKKRIFEINIFTKKRWINYERTWRISQRK